MGCFSWLPSPNGQEWFVPEDDPKMVDILQRNGYDFNVWQNVISTFRKYALGGISSTTTTLRAENLFQQARMLVGELSQRAQAFRRLQFVKQEELLNTSASRWLLR